MAKTFHKCYLHLLLCRHTHCVCCRHLLLNLRNICVQETVLSLEQLLRGPSGVPMSNCSQGSQWGPHEQLLLPAWITCHECGLILRVLFVLAAWYIRLSMLSQTSQAQSMATEKCILGNFSYRKLPIFTPFTCHRYTTF